MAPTRRTTLPAPVSNAVNFGDDDFYVAGGGLPEGDYCLFFDVRNYQPTKQDGTPAGPSRLGVMLTAYSLTEPSAEPKTKFLSMGSNADKSFAPDPDSADANGLCKRLMAIPNAAGVTAPDSTNWNFFRKSLIDSGMPKGVFTNDISVLDGVWAHVSNIPEPEERKSFANKAQTGEVQQEERRGNQTIPVVTEIKDGGAPWEGGGGIPEAKPAGPKAAPARPGPKAAPARPAVVAAPTEDTADLETAAISGVSAVLEANPDGLKKLKLRIETFKAVKAASDEATAQQVVDGYFGTDAGPLESLLGQLGYKTKGTDIVAQ